MGFFPAVTSGWGVVRWLLLILLDRQFESACLASQSDEKACVRPLVSNAIAVPVMKGQRPTGSKLWGSEYSVLMRIDGSVKETSD